MRIKKLIFFGSYSFLILLLSSNWNFSFSQVTASVVGNTLVYPTSPHISDASFATLAKDDDELYTFKAHCTYTYRYTGTIDDPIKENTCISYVNENYFSIPASLRTTTKVFNDIEICHTLPAYRRVAFYLMNIFDLGTVNPTNGKKILLGFAHLEYMEWVKEQEKYWSWNPPGWKYRDVYKSTYSPKVSNPPAPNIYDFGGGSHHYAIGLCLSDNGGESWKFAGNLVGVFDATPGQLWNNIGGTGILSIGEYIYVYFSETVKVNYSYTRYPSVARAKLSDIISAARCLAPQEYSKIVDGGGNPTSEYLFKKYNHISGTFNLNPFPGASQPGSQIIFSENSDEIFDTHCDAAYCSGMGQYLIALQKIKGYTNPDTKLFLYQSSDGIHWGFGKCVANSYSDPITGNMHRPSYPFFAKLGSGSSSDCNTVGNDFNLFYIAQVYSDVIRPVDQPLYKTTIKTVNFVPIFKTLLSQ